MLNLKLLLAFIHIVNIPKFMRALLVAIFFLLFPSLSAESAREAEGYFNTNRQDDGRYLVEFKGMKFEVRSYFPAKPKFSNQSAYHILKDPLMQFFLIVSKHQSVTADHMMRMVLADIGHQYRGLDLQVVNVKKSDLEETESDGLKRIFQQFVLDLSNGFREFVTVNLYRNSEYDVTTLTRFTLSPTEKEDLDYRMKGNDMTKKFHDETQVKIPPEVTPK